MDGSNPYGPFWAWASVFVIICVCTFSFIGIQIFEVKELEEASSKDLIVVKVSDKRVESEDGKVKFVLQLRPHAKSSLEEVEVNKELYNSVEEDDTVQYKISESNELIVKKN